MVGSAPITWLDIDAFLRVTRLRLDPAEIEIIEMLDGVFLSKQAEQVKAALSSRES